MKRFVFLLGLATLFASSTGCTGTRSSASPADPVTVELVDADATPETRALFANLRPLAPDHLLFGHQDDLAYGVTWFDEPGRSDTKDAYGAYPAVYGWEIGDLELGAIANLDSVRFDDMQRWIIEGHGRGGVITIAWHMANPVTGGDTWDRTPAIYAVLPGGEKHAEFLGWLDTFVTFLDGLRDADGRPIPVIFRPYHEHSGSWFWWGADHATPEEYTALWRMTVEHLRDTRGVHHLLYAYSPDVIDTEAEYLERYPGDDWVDVLGMDDYKSIKEDSTLHVFTSRMAMLGRMARERGKLAALSETGREGTPDPTWWTRILLRGLQADPDAQRIAWALVWRNANAARREAAGQSPTHFYGPHPASLSADDFRTFADTDFVLMEDELPDLYRVPNPGP